MLQDDKNTVCQTAVPAYHVPGHHTDLHVPLQGWHSYRIQVHADGHDEHFRLWDMPGRLWHTYGSATCTIHACLTYMAPTAVPTFFVQMAIGSRS
jgi:hypothetical protein